jgi:signal transduction histidine kinase
MGPASSARPPVAVLLAETDRLADLVAGFRARACEATGARRSVLLELEAGSDRLWPTSAAPLEPWCAGAWLTGPADAALVASVLAGGQPRQVAPLPLISQELSRRLQSPAAILAPVISSGSPLGLLVLGVPTLPAGRAWIGAVVENTAGLAVALSRARLQRDTHLQRGLDDLVVALGRSGTPGLPIESLWEFCVGAARLLPADRVALWRHDRIARRLVLVATSDARQPAEPVTVPAADVSSPAALGLRHTRAGFVPTGPGLEVGAGTDAVVPLRGRRRALGVVVLDGVRMSAGDEARVLIHLDGLGRQLANLLENAQLIDEVLRATREIENAFDSMEDVVLVCDPQGRVTRANAAAARRLGRSRASIESSPVTSLVGDALSAWLSGPAVDESHAHQARTAEIDDGVMGGIFRVTVAPIVTAGGGLAGSVVVAHDVSEERRIEADRAALGEALAQSQAMTHLVAGIAHELNNPLQAVLGHAELLRRTEALPRRISTSLRQVYRESDRAARIVGNLLFLAGSGHVVRRPVSVNAAVRRALALRAGPCRRAGIVIERHLADDLPRVSGDGLLLQQAVHNILLNAEQALGDGGRRIVVRTSCSNSRRCISITVQDNGPGVPADVLPRIFEPFFTTKEAGSGLGLAMVRRIVREHGGEIGAANRRGGGAVFTLRLPARSVIQ